MGLGLDLGLSLGRGGSGSGAGPWNPGRLGTSLLGWWDAERADKLTLNASSVTTWTDIVGNYAATQAVAGAKPTYSATSFNGRPGVTFDGTDDELTVASQPFPSGATASEIWALASQDALVANTTGRRVFSYGGGGINDARELLRVVAVGVNRGEGLVGDGITRGSSDEATIDLSGRHVMRLQIGATTSTVSIDGTAAVAAASVPATGTARVRIGAGQAAAAAGFWQGAISAVLVTRALTTPQAASLLAYLNSRR